MRLPVVPSISTKDGVSNKNARLTNCLKESKKSGDMAVIRPGLVLDAVASGVGNGLVSFNGELVSVYGTTLGLNTAAASSGLTLITDTIDGATDIQSVRYMTGTEWLIGGINLDNEEGELYVLDTSDDSTTRVGIGLGIFDIKAIASSGTTVVVASRDESFGGGPSGIFVSSVSPISFVDESLSGDDPFSIKYSDSRYVAIHSNGRVTWSADDGATWSEYSLPVGSGRTLLYDGSAWWFFGGNGLTVAPWAYKTADFVTFSVQTLTGLGALEAIVSCAYADGYYYLIGSSLKASTDGLAWSEISTSGIQVKEASDGNAYVGKSTPDTLYRLDGLTMTTINATAFTGSHRGTDALPDSSVLISATNSASVARVDPAGDDTIPALATITGTQFDFSQSPL